MLLSCCCCCHVVVVDAAHAKLMCREEVGVQDAVVAVTVMECSMQGSALLGAINVLHLAFPSNADEEYALQGICHPFQMVPVVKSRRALMPIPTISSSTTRNSIYKWLLDSCGVQRSCPCTCKQSKQHGLARWTGQQCYQDNNLSWLWIASRFFSRAVS